MVQFSSQFGTRCPHRWRERNGSYYNQRAMAKRRKQQLELHRTLKGGMPGLEPCLGGTLANAAAVCLDRNRHTSGVELAVSGQYRRRVSVLWDGPTDQIRRSYADLHEATEFGAAGVATAALNNFGGWVVMQRSRKGTGFDYWISKKDERSGPLFQNCAPLEVSGILSGDENELHRRVRIKKEQISVASTRRGKVAVVEFSAPRTRIVAS
jgi:hypothetical protein